MVKNLVCKERLQINANCSDPKCLTYGVLKILNIQMDLYFLVVEHLWQVVVAYEKKTLFAMKVIHF